ncbi:MAG: hypothetical protein J6C00_05615 [Eubacterium sp.]|nr:hypothetical protein [Eubacterium sp.]
MTEEIKKGLHPKLKAHICELERASRDTTNAEPMCTSKIEVVNFDRIPRVYARGRGWRSIPKSNDALYIDIQQKWHFIEFKNGEVKKGDIYRKLYDSLIMLIEWGVIPDFDFSRENIDYILVYNADRYGKDQKAPAREQTYSYIMGLAEQEERLFDIDDFEKYLFRKTHTYTKAQFEERFVRPMEEEEQINLE